MKISQPERGGNGVRAAVVNQWLPSMIAIHGCLGLPWVSGDLRASLR
jgi:hypothetical protein